MSDSAARRLMVAEAERTIRAGSRSFRAASRLFDRETRERAWLLYAWCRHCDDECDGQRLGFGWAGNRHLMADRFLYEGEEEPLGDRPLRVAKGHLERFKRELRALEDGLSGVVSLRRLESRGGTSRSDEFNELLEHLQFCITGEAQPVRLPKTPVHLDAVLGGQDFYPGIQPRVGRKHVASVAIGLAGGLKFSRSAIVSHKTCTKASSSTP